MKPRFEFRTMCSLKLWTSWQLIMSRDGIREIAESIVSSPTFQQTVSELFVASNVARNSRSNMEKGVRQLLATAHNTIQAQLQAGPSAEQSSRIFLDSGSLRRTFNIPSIPLRPRARKGTRGAHFERDQNEVLNIWPETIHSKIWPKIFDSKNLTQKI